MWLGLLIAFGVGIFVGYKYPREVEQTTESAKKIFNDLKDKISKKGNS